MKPSMYRRFKIISNNSFYADWITDVLLDLGAAFPGRLLNNSVFSLLSLENPQFYCRST